MKAKRYYHSLRFKITVGLLVPLVVVLTVTSYLRYVSFQRLLAENLAHSASNAEEIIEAQLAAYLRSRALLVAGSIIVILLIGNLMMSKMVVNRLEQFLQTVKRIDPGSLDARVAVEGNDELAELAEAFNRMTEELQRQAAKLSTLNTLAATVSQSLNLDQVLQSGLDQVLKLMKLGAGWVTLHEDHDQEFRLAASRGLTEEAAIAHKQCNWKRCICARVFESGQSQVFHSISAHPCPAAEHLQREGFVFRTCVPLKSKDRVLGVMSLAGVASDNAWMLGENPLDTLTAVGRQIGIAIESARLYEELSQREMLRTQLLERGMDLQEEERKRIARELHDQTSQRLTSIIMTLGALGQAKSQAEVQTYVRELRHMAAQTLEEVHDLALELRPRLLDDLGLVAALRHHLADFRDRFRMPVDLQVGLEDKRLPPRIETALYRIAQEALTNAARHAQARSVGVLLEHREASVLLIVEDDGTGFDVSEVMGSHVHKGNLGLYGMQERASLLGGTLTIESSPGMGTSVYVEIPLEDGKENDGKDPSIGC